MVEPGIHIGLKTQRQLRLIGSNPIGSTIYYLISKLEWWNGIHGGLRNHCRKD